MVERGVDALQCAIGRKPFAWAREATLDLRVLGIQRELSVAFARHQPDRTRQVEFELTPEAIAELLAVGKLRPLGRAVGAVDAGLVGTLRGALEQARSDLFPQVEGKHGPEVAANYPSVVRADAALKQAREASGAQKG